MQQVLAEDESTVRFVLKQPFAAFRRRSPQVTLVLLALRRLKAENTALLITGCGDWSLRFQRMWRSRRPEKSELLEGRCTGRPVSDALHY